MSNQTEVKKLQEALKSVKDDKAKEAIEKKIKQINKTITK